MRWKRARFALFAVAAVASGVFAAPPAAHAAPFETETTLLWDQKAGEALGAQPSGDTSFFVSVANVGDDTSPIAPKVCAEEVLDNDCPADTLVRVKIDADPEVVHPLRRIDPEDHAAAVSGKFTVHLENKAHYFTSRYAGTGPDDDDLAASVDELGFAIPRLLASPEPSSAGDVVTYTFRLETHTASPQQPRGTVRFTDNEGHDSGVRPLTSSRTAEWQVAQFRADSVTMANFTPADDSTYYSVRTQYAHSVTPGASPPASSGPGPTSAPPTTARRTTTTARARARVALAPIGGATTSTSIPTAETTTSVTFGVFPTTPPPTSDLTAASDDKGDGPPIVVVVSTLGALGVLGAIAAIRRYRRSAIDWF